MKYGVRKAIENYRHARRNYYSSLTQAHGSQMLNAWNDCYYECRSTRLDTFQVELLDGFERPDWGCDG